MNADRLKLLRLLADRLERLNADSRWAHRASGTRGEIIKLLSVPEPEDLPPENLEGLIQKSFEILDHAAREIPDFEELRKL